MNPVVRIRRNSDLEAVGELDSYKTLTIVQKFNDVSRWILSIPGDHPLIDELGTGSGYGVYITRGDETLISGPITRWAEYESSDDFTVELNGPSDSIWLDRRLILPSASPYTGSAYDTRTGAAETVLHAYVNNNLGPGAGSRAVSNLVMGTDGAHGSTVTGKGRFQNTNDFLQRLALAGGGLGFQIVQVGLTLEFQTYVPADLTDSVIFSAENQNLSEFHYERNAPNFNYVISGGTGVGTARTFREDGDSPAIAEWGRAEFFDDQRNTTTSADLDQSIAEKLAGAAESQVISFTPVDTEAIQYGRDYNLGDTVKAVSRNGRIIEEIIREVTLSHEPRKAEQVSVVVGTPGVSNPDMPDSLDEIPILEERLDDLERI